MKKTWRTVLWVFTILFLLGLALMATGLLSGASDQSILAHGGFTRYLEWLRRVYAALEDTANSLL